jgi:hypothetical protein
VEDGSSTRLARQERNDARDNGSVQHGSAARLGDSYVREVTGNLGSSLWMTGVPIAINRSETRSYCGRRLGASGLCARTAVRTGALLGLTLASPGGGTAPVDPGKTFVVASAAWPPVMDEIADGLSLAEVAACYGISIGVVRRWLEDDPAAVGRTGRDVGWLRDA